MKADMLKIIEIAAIPVMAILAYALMRWLSLVLTQPMRLRLADVGEAALLDPAIPDRDKEAIRHWLDHAFDGRMIVFLAALAPAIIIAVFVVLIHRRFRRIHAPPVAARDYHPTTVVVTRLAMIGCAGASPLATAIVALELFCLHLLFKPLSVGISTFDAIYRRLNGLFRAA